MNKESYYYSGKLKQFNRFSQGLNKMIKNGSFYRLSIQKRNSLLRRLKRLYNQLTAFVPALKLKHILGAAAALLFSLGVGTTNGQSFGPVQTNPFGLTKISAYVDSRNAKPHFVDIDGDGDLDLFAGERKGTVQYFKNTGSNFNPVFDSLQTNPFGLTSIVGNYSAPNFVDIDGDGDFDAFIGNGKVGIPALLYFENTGTNTAPAFAASLSNPFGLSSFTGDKAAPSFVDIDGDGDFDLFAGNGFGELVYFENTGTNTAPAFAALQTNPFGITNSSGDNPDFVDINGDGDFDIIVGDVNGKFQYFENTGTNLAPAFAAAQISPFGLDSVTFLAAPDFADIDGDGDLDAIVGESSGKFKYFANTGNSTNPAFAAPSTNPFGLTSVMTYDTSYVIAPAFVDIDSDGDFDAFVGDGWGRLNYFANTGTNTAPVFAAPQVNPFGLDSVGGYAVPTFVDIDADGDFDIFVSEYYGYVQYFENTGTTTAPAFAAPQSSPFGISNPDTSDIIAPTFVDIDGDGDFDAFIGEYYGNIRYFENTGNSTSPAFGASQNLPFGLDSIYAYIAAPTFVDIDKDGDFDAFVGGEYYGSFKYFENTGTSTAPAFGPVQTNPFGLTNVAGYIFFPTFVDIDGDGDLDLFVGDYYGSIKYFENTSPLTGIDESEASLGNSEFDIYPNPANEKLHIRINGKNELKDFTLEITNSLGQTLLKEQINVSAKGYVKDISTADFAKGIYFIRLQSGKNTFYRKLIVH